MQLISKRELYEIFSAYDTHYQRIILLKRLRKDILNREQVAAHLLYEARLTCQLSHPSIIPIFSIVSEQDETYYTMPLIEGSSLKQLLQNALNQEEAGHQASSSCSVAVLSHSFLSICQALAYVHSKGIMHRDIKPSNVMVGPYGEVTLIDWGLAIQVHPSNLSARAFSHIAGTIPYLAPEQTYGEPASFLTEIYALGLILYEILTLRYPFHRETIAQLRHTVPYEVLLNPLQAAPHRDIPPILSQIALKCLASPNARYQNIEELLNDLENFLKRRTGWFQLNRNTLQNSTVWDTAHSSHLQYCLKTIGKEREKNYCLLVSKAPMPSILSIQLKIKPLSNASFALLLNIPPTTEWNQMTRNSGLCLFASTQNAGLLLFTERSLAIPEMIFKEKIEQIVRIEKIEQTLFVYLDEILQCCFVNYIPEREEHLGILYHLSEIDVSDFTVSMGGQFFKKQPLAVPDAFLALKKHAIALQKYRDVATQYPCTLEGNKALFRGGLALLNLGDSIGAFKEFSKLHESAAEPLEYLGKALIEQANGKIEKELALAEKAFELYETHPQISVWQHHLLSRLLEEQEMKRQQQAHFLLLVLRYLPLEKYTPHIWRSLHEVRQREGSVYFINDFYYSSWPESLQIRAGLIRLAFWLAKPDVLASVINEQLALASSHVYTICNALFALLELGECDMVEKKLKFISSKCFDIQAITQFNWIHEALLSHQRQEFSLSSTFLAELPQTLTFQSLRSVLHIFYAALDLQQTTSIYQHVQLLKKNHQMGVEERWQLDYCLIAACLIDKNWEKTSQLLDEWGAKYSRHSSYFFLRGCWLAATFNRKVAYDHFKQFSDDFMCDNNGLFIKYYDLRTLSAKRWFSEAFLWEKRCYLRQKLLFDYCGMTTGNFKK